ncbi:MAG: WD40 repeat domain-containing protein [Woronichinia naegeliana WA131]|uniref:WD40 repeat domain-containing protein n=1 Tax=Woronichinia naegeliana WA131 TaxID=2824559 RepID=A0A977PTN2_9CYAN|nr:MAG: WD40 repeat domain-containing protein [Woronichinia naegeliana WA131]
MTDFIEELREEGYKIGISQYIAAQKLVLTLIDQGETLDSPGSLGGYLGPIFCSSPTEQEDFQQRFKLWLDSIPISPAPETTTSEVHSLDTKAQVLSQELSDIQSHANQLTVGLVIVATVLIAALFPLIWNPSRTPTIVATPSPTLASPTPKASSSVPTPSPSPKPSIKPSPPSESSKLVFKPVVNASSPFFCGWQQKWLIFFILAVPITVFLYALRRGLWSQQADLFLKRLGMDREPKLEKISIQGVEQDLFPPLIFNQIARGLKRRVHIPSQQLDVNKTIEATLKKGSWLSPVYGTYQTLVEYLFLVDSASFRDHQAQFVEEMINCLKKDGVLITVYFFEGDPRICFSKERNNSPRKLQEIIHQYHDRCLIVVSDSDRFFSDISGELEPWVSQLKTWEKRAVLTPNPISNWSNQEFFLAQNFIVLPATAEGLQVLSQVLNPEVIKSYLLSGQVQTPLPEQLLIHSFHWLDRSPPTAAEITSMLKSLEEYLGNDGYYWFTACAVFPELHWNITLYLGTQLKTQSNQSLAEVCSPIKLARLPWFRSGYMPDWLRSLLILKLTKEQELTIRSALQNLLVSSVQGTVNQQQLEVATQYEKMLPDLLNPMLRLLSKRSEDGSPLRDYLFLDFMQGKPILATKVPDELRDSLKRKNLLPRTLPRTFGEWLVAAVIITGATLLPLFGLQQWHRWRVGALLTAAETTSTGESVVNNVFEAITATGLSHSTLVQFPEYPPFPSVEESLLKIIQAEQSTKVLSHPSQVWSVSYSPDGKTLASADGKTLASASADNTVKLWDVGTGKELETLNGHQDQVISVSYSPDGKTLASASYDKTVKLWDVVTGKELKTLNGHQDSVSSVSFSPDGKTLASGSADKTVKLWDVVTGKELKTLNEHHNGVASVSFSPDGKTLASASWDKTVKLWDVGTGKELNTLNGHPEEVNSVSFSPDGKTLASGSGDGTVKLWDVGTGKELKTLKGHPEAVNSVSFSPDGKTLAAASLDKTVKLWDVGTGKELKTLNGHQNGVVSVSFPPDGKTLASGSADKTVRIWEVKALWDNGKEPPISQPLRGHEDQVFAVAFRPDRNQIVSGGPDKTLRLWDGNTGKTIGNPLQGHTAPVRALAYSPDGKYIVSGGSENILRLWDAETGKAIATLQGHTGEVNSVAFSPDGKRIVSGSDDKTLRIWDAETGKAIRTLSGHTDWVRTVAFSPDGKRIVSGSLDKTLRIWDTETGKAIATLPGHTDTVYSVVFSPDGKRIVSGSSDKTLRIWDVETGKTLTTLQGHTGEVNSVAFSPDSKRIASGSYDKTLRLWDAETGKAIGKPLKGHTGEVISVAFSPDGKRIVSGSNDNTLRIWHISWEYLLPILCNQLQNHPNLKEPSTDVAWEAKETCEHFVWAKSAESTAKPSPINP